MRPMIPLGETFVWEGQKLIAIEPIETLSFAKGQGTCKGCFIMDWHERNPGIRDCNRNGAPQCTTPSMIFVPIEEAVAIKLTGIAHENC